MKRAFTMIELLMVMVVVGIIVAVALPRFNRDNIYQAANQVASHIRYTQHLAMQENMFDPNNQFWYRGRWQIQFYQNITNTNTCTENMPNAWAYTIYSDAPGYTGNPNVAETARNPQNPNQLLSGGFNNTICIDSSENPPNANATPQMRLGEKYGIELIDFSNSCSLGGSQRIAFDNFGRPLRGAFQNYTSPYPVANRLITAPCIISLCTTNPCPAADGEDRVRISIEPETGYVRIIPSP